MAAETQETVTACGVECRRLEWPVGPADGRAQWRGERDGIEVEVSHVPTRRRWRVSLWLLEPFALLVVSDGYDLATAEAGAAEDLAKARGEVAARHERLGRELAGIDTCLGWSS